MSRMSIALDKQAQIWVQAQAGDDAEAYVNDLVHKDQARRKAEAELREMLQEADASGISDRTVDDIWAAAEARYLTRHA